MEERLENIRRVPRHPATTLVPSAHRPPILLLLLLRVLLLTDFMVLAGPTDRVVVGESVDLIVSHGRQTEQRLFGSFSPAGLNYEVQGDVVQVSSFRACDARRKGLDRTLFGHVAVVFVDEVQPFLTGCVALDNQARFAEKSGALALVVGPASRIQRNRKPLKVRASKIPVIVLDDQETQRLRNQLAEAERSAAVAHLRLDFIDTKPPHVLKLQVFRPSLLNLSLIGLLVVLVLFITLLVFVKIRWRPTVHRDLWLRTLARAAVGKMEIRKFQKEPSRQRRRPFARLRRVRSTYLPVFGSLTSVANTASSQERCSICLDEYAEGTELRVLFCGHEFHPKCVDPWLLSNRRCPLCQFDVVYKQYPKMEPPSKCRQTPPSTDNSPLEPLLLSSAPIMESPRMARDPSGAEQVPRSSQDPLQVVRDVAAGRGRRVTSRARSLPRRRPLRPREHVETAVRLGGYSSDVSSR
ncbi:unnamed protein product [Cylicocyclus nassatus]|uniref:RING-type domain-containing protein n=1 Tax=Cylicocyclus nassatus TaxID=53992 RepID=A0AA36M5G4_CYLNA|nr:unnamed protein product [Cylicocyclus nassatus]